MKRSRACSCSPPASYVLSSTHELFNFGSLWLSAGQEAVTPTEVADAGSAEATAIAAENAARRILIDDGYSIRVDAAAHVGEQPYFTKNTVVRLGDTLVPPAAPMVLGYGFNQWRLQPQVPLTDASAAAYKPTFTATNPRPDAAPAVGGDVQFGSFNVFNYFTTLSSVNPDARGAATAAQFAIQKSKIVSAINGLGADVVALEEVQNNVEYGEPVDTALADLVAGPERRRRRGHLGLRARRPPRSRRREPPMSSRRRSSTSRRSPTRSATASPTPMTCGTSPASRSRRPSTSAVARSRWSRIT